MKKLFITKEMFRGDLGKVLLYKPNVMRFKLLKIPSSLWELSRIHLQLSLLGLTERKCIVCQQKGKYFKQLYSQRPSAEFFTVAMTLRNPMKQSSCGHDGSFSQTFPHYSALFFFFLVSLVLPKTQLLIISSTQFSHKSTDFRSSYSLG